MGVGMRISHLRRYPVKSFQGEELESSIVDADGLRGDRAWGVRDDATGKILTGRREPRLLLAGAVLASDGEPEITLPDGSSHRGTGAATDDALSSWLGRPVSLVAASDDGGVGATAEYFDDATDDTSMAIEWTMPPGRFVDAGPLLLLTTASVRAAAELHPDGVWDLRRLRPNLVVAADGDGWPEDDWCGFSVAAGEALLDVVERCERCTMVTRVQPGLERDLDIYRVLARHHQGTLGVWASVRTPGTVRVSDEVALSSDRPA